MGDGQDMGGATKPAEVVRVPSGGKVPAARQKDASGANAGTTKGLKAGSANGRPAERVAAAATAVAAQAGSGPVEWWKPGALKAARTARAATRQTVKASAGRRARTSS